MFIYNIPITDNNPNRIGSFGSALYTQHTGKAIGTDGASLFPINRETDPIGRTFERGSFSGLVSDLIGRPPENKRYEDYLASITKIGNFKKGSVEYKQALKKNLEHNLIRSAEVLDIVEKNIAAEKKDEQMFDGLSPEMGLPPNSELIQLSGGWTKENQFRYNVLSFWFNYFLFNEQTIFDSKDADGTFVDKSLTIFATRFAQAYSQMHHHKRIIDICQEHGFSTTMVNTARLEHAVLIGAEGLKYLSTIVPHNSGIEELQGFSLKEQYMMLLSAEIAMGNGSVRTKKGEDFTFISANMQISDQLVQFLENNPLALGEGESNKSFVEEVFKGPARKYEYSVNEVKGLNNYVMDHQHILGEASYEHGKLINLFYEEEVTNRKEGVSYEQGLENFKNALLKNINDGVGHWEAYRAFKLIIDEKTKKGETTSSSDNDKLCALRKKALEHVRLIGSSTDSIESVQEKIKQLNSTTRAHHSGENKLDTEKRKEYEERLERESSLKYNYVEKLKRDPREFFEFINGGRPTGFCSHFFNSRGTPYELAIKLAKSNMRKFGYNETVRNKIQELRLQEYKKIQNGEITFNDINKDVLNYINEGMSLYKKVYTETTGIDQVKAREATLAFVNWKLKEHLELHFKEDEVSGLSFVEVEKDAEGKVRSYKIKHEELIAEWKSHISNGSGRNSNQEVEGYLDWLQEKIESEKYKLKGEDTGDYLKKYLEGIINEEFITGECYLKVDDSGNICSYANDSTKPRRAADPLAEFMPDELFSVKGQRACNGKTSTLSVLRLDEKSDALNPLGQFYYEIIANNLKSDVLPSFLELHLKDMVAMNSGDTSSDVDAHAGALLRGGIARIVYNIITPEDIYNKVFIQKEKLYSDYLAVKKKTESSKTLTDKITEEKLLLELYYAYNRFNAPALVFDKDSGSYCEVITKKVNADTPGAIRINYHPETTSSHPATLKNGDYVIVEILKDKPLSKNQAIDKIRLQYWNKIDISSSPAEMLCKLALVVQLITGENIDFLQTDFEKAKTIKARKNKGETVSQADENLLQQYNWAIIEEQSIGKLPLDRLRFDHFVEFNDGKTKYYMKKDGRLFDLEGKIEFKGNSDSLQQRKIKRDPISGIFVYEDNNQPFEHHNKLPEFFALQENLPTPTKISGIFSWKWLLNILGFGNKESGSKRLEGFFRKLPKLFPQYLEWAGGLMALGGGIRLLGLPFGGNEGLIYKAGYWLSNGFRAVSAFLAANRGILNVHKNWDIALAEFGNVIASVFLPNGLKHLLLAIDNGSLFFGRGIQAAMRSQRVNAPTEEEKKTTKLNLQKYIDPRPIVSKSVKFVTDMTLSISNSCKEVGLSATFGEIFGRIIGSFATGISMFIDVCKKPSLIFYWAKRIPEKTGLAKAMPASGGHILASTGLVAGVLGIGSAIFGRMERFGDVAEHGFNRLGDWLIAGATAIPAFGIIANGWELALNPLGLPKKFTGLDGKEVTYNPKRAGYGQILAGLGYLVSPFFGLHKDSVASAFDILNGAYFGLPGMKMSVAEEEKINSFKMAQGELVKGQVLFTSREEKENPFNTGKDYVERAQKYEKYFDEVENKDKYRYNPNASLGQAV